MENMHSNHGADLKIIVAIGGNDEALFIQLSKEETEITEDSPVISGK